MPIRWVVDQILIIVMRIMDHVWMSIITSGLQTVIQAALAIKIVVGMIVVNTLLLALSTMSEQPVVVPVPAVIGVIVLAVDLIAFIMAFVIIASKLWIRLTVVLIKKFAF